VLTVITQGVLVAVALALFAVYTCQCGIGNYGLDFADLNVIGATAEALCIVYAGAISGGIVVAVLNPHRRSNTAWLVGMVTGSLVVGWSLHGWTWSDHIPLDGLVFTVGLIALSMAAWIDHAYLVRLFIRRRTGTRITRFGRASHRLASALGRLGLRLAVFCPLMLGIGAIYGTIAYLLVRAALHISSELSIEETIIIGAVLGVGVGLAAGLVSGFWSALLSWRGSWILGSLVAAALVSLNSSFGGGITGDLFFRAIPALLTALAGLFIELIDGRYESEIRFVPRMPTRTLVQYAGSE
jgi:hypothetical protein